MSAVWLLPPPRSRVMGLRYPLCVYVWCCSTPCETSRACGVRGAGGVRRTGASDSTSDVCGVCGVRVVGASAGSGATVDGACGVGGVRLARATSVGSASGMRGASGARMTCDAIGGASGVGHGGVRMAADAFPCGACGVRLDGFVAIGGASGVCAWYWWCTFDCCDNSWRCLRCTSR
jgi:hypothetical protein